MAATNPSHTRLDAVWWVVPPAVLALTLGGAFLALAVIGSYTRYMADDYCMAAVLHSTGFWGAQKIWYDSSTGSVAYSFAATAAALLPPQVVSYWPVLALVLWWGALYWAIWQIGLAAQPARRAFTAALLAGVVLLVTLDTTPHLFQSFFWLDGALRYLAPEIFITLSVGLVFYCQRRTLSGMAWWAAMSGSVALTFISGTFSETHMALQVGLVALAIAVVRLLLPAASRRRRLPWLAAGLAGSLLAVAVTVAAPGTMARKADFGPVPGWLSVLGLTWQFGGRFLQLNLDHQLIGLLAVAVLPMCLAWQFGDTTLLANAEPTAASEAAATWRRTAVWLCLIALSTLALIFLSLAPAAWALTFFPPGRVLLVPQYALVVALAACGYVVGCALRATTQAGLSGQLARVSTSSLTLVACLAALYPLSTAQRVMGWHPIVSAQAATWDDFHDQMRKAKRAGLSAISLPAPDNIANLKTIGADPNSWVNGCVSVFYGVSVTGYPPPRVVDGESLARLTPIQARFGEAAQLKGYRLEGQLFRPGDALIVTVAWLPLAHTDRPYTVFIHLLDSSQRSIAQQDTVPLNGAYATTDWIPGRLFLDTYVLHIPASAPAPSQARIVIGLYDRKTMTRLRVTGPASGPDSEQWVQLGSVGIDP